MNAVMNQQKNTSIKGRVNNSDNNIGYEYMTYDLYESIDYDCSYSYMTVSPRNTSYT